MRNKRHSHGKKHVAIKILFIPAYLFLGAWILQLLWNYAAPTAFGAGILSYWQTLALMIAARILFGMPGRIGRPKRHHFQNRDQWKAQMKDRYGPSHGGAHPHGGPHSHHHRGFHDHDCCGGDERKGDDTEKADTTENETEE